MITPICGFCSSIGINGPHDHWMRIRRNGEYKTICPKLLQTICQTCFKKGHTAKYCTKNIIVKEKKTLDKTINNLTPTTKKETKTKFINMWEALCMESDNSDDNNDSDNDDNDDKNVLNQVDDFNKKPYVYLRWEDVDTDDGELPPLPASCNRI